MTDAMPNYRPPASRYVLIPVFCAATGYTEKAVRRKIQSGVWLQDQLWRKAPDGHIFIDMEGYHKWVERQISPGSKSAAVPSASSSTGAIDAAAKR